MSFSPFITPSSTQMKRDFLVAQSTTQAPPGFATGPSLAARPLSRTASMATEAADNSAPTPIPTESLEDPDASPIFLPNHKEVSKHLHLAAPPTTKAGQKEKAETAVAAAARANANITRLGGHLIAEEAKVSAQFLAFGNELRALSSKTQRINAGKLEEQLATLEGLFRNKIDNFSGTSDARVSLHTADLARITDNVETLQHQLRRITESPLCDERGDPVMDRYATRGDVNALYGSIQDAFDGVNEEIAEQLAPALAKADSIAAQLATLAPAITKADSMAAQLASLEMRFEARMVKMEKKQEEVERSSLTVRENVARTQTDLSTFILRSAPSSTVAVAPAAPPPPPPPLDVVRPARFDFAVGGKKQQHKRKASVEIITCPAKRASARPDKSSFHHWVNVGPVSSDRRIAAPEFFRALVVTGAPDYHLPATYIERVATDPSILAVGFSSANEANGFVGAWAGAKAGDDAPMPFDMRTIMVTHASVAGSSHTPNYFTGN
ncbi:hypothetical protein B0H17DRAFT_513587 [Mycena rosella]|uniref:Uncharacterized protein n=1 Tax=Mycena rosella TaxID=1033263 RepID=A0AAD7BVR0_MYCRO|nr:hypothetical protein B0H17DRAFT_513587 [Mycena rosella]